MALLSLAWIALAFSAPAAGAEARPEPCTAANSIRTDVLAIHRQPERYVGRCVSLAGPASGISLYSGIEGLYLSGRSGPDGNVPEERLRHRIGLYAPENAIRRFAAGRKSGMMRLEVTGRVDTCERMQDEAARRQAGEPGIFMMTGYCHYHRGPVVHVSEWRHDARVRFERLTGERARQRVGNLIPAPVDWPARAFILALVDDFRRALVAGDRARLAELHNVKPDTSHETDRLMLDYLLDRPGSSFGELRRGAELPLALFIHPSQNTAEGRAKALRYPAATVCFCRTQDCSKSWPIAGNDTVNAPERPYACTSIEPRDWGARKAGLQTGVGGLWLAEPRRTAFRRD